MFFDMIDECKKTNFLESVTATEKDIDNFIEYALSNCADDQYNFNAIMRPLALYEMGMYKKQLLDEDGGEMVAVKDDKQVKKGFFNKFKEWVKAAWSRIAGMFKSFKNMIIKKAGAIRDFITKHKKSLSAKYAASKDKISKEGYKYNLVIDMKAIRAAISEEIADMKNSHSEKSEPKEEKQEIADAIKNTVGGAVDSVGGYFKAAVNKMRGEKVKLVDIYPTIDAAESALKNTDDIEKNANEMKKFLEDIAKACDAAPSANNDAAGKSLKNIKDLVIAAQQILGAQMECAKEETAQIKSLLTEIAKVKESGKKEESEKEAKSESADSIFGNIELI